MSLPAVGDLAPEVTLPDETGTLHHLSDQRGRWTILYFYPTDDTSGCTIEACEFRDSNETIRERGAEGRGLRIIGRVAQKWGVFQGTTHVWFEIPLDGADDARVDPTVGEPAPARLPEK